MAALPLFLPLSLYTCVYVCEMVVKIVEMHLPLGCFVDFLWLRAGRSALWSRSWPVSPLLDSDSDSGSDSCLCHMRGATMLFAVSQISRSLHKATDISHMYFVWFFSAPALALLHMIVMFAALLVLHFTHSMTSNRIPPLTLLWVFSYAFTRNSCGWQLVQNSSSCFQISIFPFDFFPFCSTFFFYFKVEKLVKRQIVVCESQGRVLISLCASDSQWKPFKSIDSEVKKTTRRRKSHRVAACRVCFSNGKSTEFLSRT